MGAFGQLWSSTSQAFVALALALVPAVHRHWSGRRIAADDPALPERLMARRSADTQVTAVSLALLVAFGWRHAWWAVPLSILGLSAAAYPLRRRVLGETWSLPVYLAWTLRFVVAIWGFWLLLFAAPFLVASAPPPSLLFAIVLAATLALWNQFYPRILLRLAGARPFDAARWPAGFRRVLDRARVPEPGIWRAGPRGCRLANALALPSLRGHHVLFTDALLDCLDDEEQAAVLAHEVSHLELFTRPRLVRWQVSSLGLVLGAVLLVPIVGAVAPQGRWLALPAWLVVVASALVMRGRVVRAQEAPSDRRAVELCGNAEAVVSGLVKLHETAKLPRRWAVAFEQRASHPSLARRIQAIRAAAGQQSAPVAFPIVLRGTDGTALLLERDRVRHLAGVPEDVQAPDALLAAAAAVAVPWGDIGELRVEAARGRGPVLVLAHANGQRWTVRLDPARVPQVQAALDTVDDRLPAALPVVHGGRIARVALLALCAALVVSLSATSALVAAVVALVVPSPGALLAAAVAGLVAAFLAIGQAASQPRVALDLMVAVPALWTAWLARRWRLAGGPPDRLAHALVGLSAVALWIAVLLHTRGDMFELHAAARAIHGLAVLPLALAAGWIWAAEIRFRRGVVVPLLLGLVALAVSTTWFVDAAVPDPLRTRGAALDVMSAELDPISEAAVDSGAEEAWFSPSGRVFATTVERIGDESSEPSTFTIGDFEGRRATLRADALAVPDDEIVVAVERTADGGLVIRAHPFADTAQTTWSVPLPTKGWGTFAVNPTTRRWRFAQAGDGEASSWEGALGAPGLVVRRTSAPAAAGGLYTEWIAADGAPIGVVYDYGPPAAVRTVLREMLGLGWHMPMTLRRGTSGYLRSHFDGTCYPAAPGMPVTCVARDGERSHLWTWDGRVLAEAGRLDGELVVQGRDPSGWIAGWLRGRLTLVRPGAAQALEVPGTCGRGSCLTVAAYTGTVLGGLRTSGGRTTIATYRVRPLDR